MPAGFSTSIDINATPQRVWEVMRDIEHWNEWTASVRSITRLDSGPLRVGSRARVRQPKLLPALFTITAIEEGSGFTWETRSPGLTAVGDHWIEAVGDKSRVSLSLRFNGLFGSIVGFFMRNLTARYIAMESAGLKQRCERLQREC